MSAPTAPSVEYPESCRALGCRLDIERQPGVIFVKHAGSPHAADVALQHHIRVGGSLEIGGEYSDAEIAGFLNEWSDQYHGDPVDPSAPHNHEMRPWRTLSHFHPERTAAQQVQGCAGCGQLACRACAWTGQVPLEHLAKRPRRHRPPAVVGQGATRPSPPVKE